MVYAIVGVPASIVFGIASDGVRPWVVLALLDACAIAFCLTSVVASEGWQYVSMVLLTLLCNAFFIVMPAFTQRYSPPELFGTAYGLALAAIGVLQMVAVEVENALSNLISSGASDGVVGKLLVWTAIVAVTAVANLWVWQGYPPPKLGTITMAYVREAQATPSASDRLAGSCKGYGTMLTSPTSSTC